MQASDLAKLNNAEPALRDLAKAVAKKYPEMGVSQTVRSLEDQKRAIAEGKSWLKDPKNGKHLAGPNGLSRALDFFKRSGDKADWNDTAWYEAVGAEFEAEAKRQGVKIVWGGRWKKTPDRPHIELA